MTGLPTAEQLKKLPLRAIAAYTARAARRVLPELRGAVDDNIIEEALSLVENVASIEHLDLLDAASAALVASRTVGEAISLRGRQDIAVLSIFSAACTAHLLLMSAFEQHRAGRYAASAGREAERTARDSVAALDEPMATAAAEAARTDYETLLKTFGEHETVVVGDPIDLSETSFLGALM